MLHNGDGLCYYDLHKELVGMAINVAEPVSARSVGPVARVPQGPDGRLQGPAQGHRSQPQPRHGLGAHAGEKSSDRRIGLWAHLSETPTGFSLMLTDEDGNVAVPRCSSPTSQPPMPPRPKPACASNWAALCATVFAVHDIALQLSQPWFVPASVLNALRRDAVADLEANRARNFAACRARRRWSPCAPHPEDTPRSWATCSTTRPTTLRAPRREGDRAAYEAHEEEGEVSLMITCTACAFP